MNAGRSKKEMGGTSYSFNQRWQPIKRLPQDEALIYRIILYEFLLFLLRAWGAKPDHEDREDQRYRDYSSIHFDF